MSSREDKILVLCLAAALALAAAARLPQLLGDHLIVDGDEGTVGIMAKHLLEGERPPIFFYGQRFGLTVFETAWAAGFFAIFGVSTVALKASMLAFWALGILFFVLAARRLAGPRSAAFAALLIAVCPAWGAWAMKARGGYLTAWALAHGALWIWARRITAKEPRRAEAALLGVCLGLIFFAQVTWLIGLLPLIALLAARRKDAIEMFMITGGAIAVVLVMTVLIRAQEPPVWAPHLFDQPDIPAALLRFPRNLWLLLGGGYYMNSPTRWGPFMIVSAALWLGALGLALFDPLRSLRRGRPLGVSQTCLFSLLAIAVFSFEISPRWYGVRHILAFTTFFFLLLALELGRLAEKGIAGRRAAWAATGALVIFSVLALTEFGRDSFAGHDLPEARPEGAAIEELIDELDRLGIGHVYTRNRLFQWQLVFESSERIIARWHVLEDRYPAYPIAVDRARLAGRPVALIDSSPLDEEATNRTGKLVLYSSHERWLEIWRELFAREGFADLEARLVAGRYIVVTDPPPTLLRRLGFKLIEDRHAAGPTEIDRERKSMNPPAR